MLDDINEQEFFEEIARAHRTTGVRKTQFGKLARISRQADDAQTLFYTDTISKKTSYNCLYPWASRDT